MFCEVFIKTRQTLLPILLKYGCTVVSSLVKIKI